MGILVSEYCRFDDFHDVNYQVERVIFENLKYWENKSNHIFRIDNTIVLKKKLSQFLLEV